MIKKPFNGIYDVPPQTTVFLDGKYYGIVKKISTTVDYETINSYDLAYSVKFTVKMEYHIEVMARPTLHCKGFDIIKNNHDDSATINVKTATVGQNPVFKYVLPYYKKSKYTAKEYVAEVDEYWNIKNKVAKIKSAPKYKSPMWNPDSMPADPAVGKLPALKERVKHPVTGLTLDLQNVIIQLNDINKWTREQIADWLETLDIDIRFGEEKNE